MKILLAFVALAFLFVTADADGRGCKKGRMVQKQRSSQRVVVQKQKSVQKSRCSGGRCGR